MSFSTSTSPRAITKPLGANSDIRVAVLGLHAESGHAVPRASNGAVAARIAGERPADQPLFLLLNALGLRDTLAALVLTYSTFSLPLAVWLLAGFFDALPRELYVAARVDGCSAFGALWRVVLPLAAPGMLAAGLLVFIFAWNEFLFALSFTVSPDMRTVPVAIALFRGQHQVPWGQILAAAVLATAPVAILVGIATGVLIGAFHGWLVGYLTIPAFIVTLGGLIVARQQLHFLERIVHRHEGAVLGPHHLEFADPERVDPPCRGGLPQRKRERVERE